MRQNVSNLDVRALDQRLPDFIKKNVLLYLLTQRSISQILTSEFDNMKYIHTLDFADSTSSNVLACGIWYHRVLDT